MTPTIFVIVWTIGGWALACVASFPVRAGAPVLWAFDAGSPDAPEASGSAANAGDSAAGAVERPCPRRRA